MIGTGGESAGRALSGEKKLINGRRRVAAALRKAERREELTGRELMIVRWVTSSGGCQACRGRVSVVVRGYREGRASAGEWRRHVE